MWTAYAASCRRYSRALEDDDYEQSHHRFERALDPALVLRGSRDFDGRPEYDGFLRGLFCRLTKGRRKRLRSNLKQLRLPMMQAEFHELARGTTDAGEGHEQYLPRLSELEVAARSANALRARIRAADFPAHEDFDAFDFAAVPGLKNSKVPELAHGQHSIREAVKEALPDAPHPLCHFHHPREAARPTAGRAPDEQRPGAVVRQPPAPRAPVERAEAGVAGSRRAGVGTPGGGTTDAAGTGEGVIGGGQRPGEVAAGACGAGVSPGGGGSSGGSAKARPPTSAG